MLQALLWAGLGIGCAALVWFLWSLHALVEYFDTYDGYQEE